MRPLDLRDAPDKQADAGDAWTDAMRRGDFPRAWALSDAVLAAREPRGRDDPMLPYHLRWVWDGTAPDRRDVLVRCYHGLGDTLQFVRFLPVLRRRARRVTLEAQPELVPLLENAPGIDILRPFRPDAPLPPSECDVEIMELAHMLRAGQTDLPPGGYLRAPPPTAVAASEAVGLCWTAGGWDPARSVPLAALLHACAGRPLVSLQRGPAASEATAPAFVNPCDASLDIRETAGLVAAVDVVVTVDTMVAHLAGALGRPTILLLKHAPDWRWPEPGARSPWYPATTPLHQSAPGNWRDPLEQLAKLLSARRER